MKVHGRDSSAMKFDCQLINVTFQTDITPLVGPVIRRKVTDREYKLHGCLEAALCIPFTLYCRLVGLIVCFCMLVSLSFLWHCVLYFYVYAASWLILNNNRYYYYYYCYKCDVRL